MLFRSGADSTLVDASIMNTEELKTMKSFKQNVFGISGQTLDILGTMECLIRMCNQKIEQQVRIMRECPYDCVIGMDVLRQLKDVVFDPSTGSLIPHKTDRRRKVAINEAYIDHNITIPARTEMICYVSLHEEQEGDVVFEPDNKVSTNYELPMCNILGTVKNGRIPIRVVNLENKPR